MSNDPLLHRCSFAKLVGENFEYYIRKYEISLGRKSKSTELDVILGDSTNVSRNHALIRYNFQAGYFELVVQGKNGVYVDGILHTPSSPPVRLRSAQRIQMGDRMFFFLLPKLTEAEKMESEITVTPPLAPVVETETHIQNS